MVVKVKVLDREHEGSKLVMEACRQWDVHKLNLNIRSLKLCQAASEEDP